MWAILKIKILFSYTQTSFTSQSFVAYTVILSLLLIAL